MAREIITGGTGGERRVVHSETRRPWESILTNFIWFVIGLILALLAFRFVLALFGANPDAGFTQLIFMLSAPFVAPFEAVFGVHRIEGATFDWNILLAMLVWALIGWAVTALIAALTPRASAVDAETVESVETEEVDHVHSHHAV
jgi:hypothetical protein